MMAKQTKRPKRRTQIKDLPRQKKRLSKKEQQQVFGGTTSPLPPGLGTTSTTITAGGGSTFGDPVTFTATVAPTSSPSTPTGTGTFLIDGTPPGGQTP